MHTICKWTTSSELHIAKRDQKKVPMKIIPWIPLNLSVNLKMKNKSIIFASVDLPCDESNLCFSTNFIRSIKVCKIEEKTRIHKISILLRLHVLKKIM